MLNYNRATNTLGDALYILKLAIDGFKCDGDYNLAFILIFAVSAHWLIQHSISVRRFFL